jgi:hypothetical protein
MDNIALIESYLGRKIGIYQCIESGRDFNVYIVWSLVFRIPKHKYIKQQITKEKMILESIKPYISLPIPQYEVIDDTYLVGRCISGIPLIYTKTVYTETIIRQISWFLQELHSIPI